MKYLFSGFYILWLRLRGYSEHEIYVKTTRDESDTKSFYTK